MCQPLKCVQFSGLLKEAALQCSVLEEVALVSGTWQAWWAVGMIRHAVTGAGLKRP